MKKLILIILFTLSTLVNAQYSNFEKYLSSYNNEIVKLVELGTTDTTRLVESRIVPGYYTKTDVKFGNYELLIADTTYIDTVLHGGYLNAEIFSNFNTNYQIRSVGLPDTLRKNWFFDGDISFTSDTARFFLPKWNDTLTTAINGTQLFTKDSLIISRSVGELYSARLDTLATRAWSINSVASYTDTMYWKFDTLISNNTTNISQNATDVLLNATSITANADSVDTLRTDLNINSQGISINILDITANADSVDTLRTEVNFNANGISSNVTDINGNYTRSTQNATNINLNAIQITTNADSVDTLRADLNIQAGEIDLRVKKDSVINSINISTEGIDIQGDNIQLTGSTTIDGSFTLNGNALINGTVTATKMNVTDLSVISANIGTIATGKLSTGGWNIGENVFGAWDGIYHSSSNYWVVDVGANRFLLGGSNGISYNSTSGIISMNSSVRVNGDVMVNGGMLYSSNYVANTSGWKIDDIGNAEFNNVLIRGELHTSAGSDVDWQYVSAVIIDSADIGNASISSANIKSLNANKINATSLSAISANLGTITAGSISSGTFQTQSASTVNGNINLSGTTLTFGGTSEIQIDVSSAGTGVLTVGGNLSSGNISSTSTIDAALGFKDNGTAGIDGTFSGAGGASVTISGGIVTAKTDATTGVNGTYTDGSGGSIVVTNGIVTSVTNGNSTRYHTGTYTGAPSNTIGNNGDIAYDNDLTGKYVKINGVWISF